MEAAETTQSSSRSMQGLPSSDLLGAAAPLSKPDQASKFLYINVVARQRATDAAADAADTADGAASSPIVSSIGIRGLSLSPYVKMRS